MNTNACLVSVVLRPSSSNNPLCPSPPQCHPVRNGAKKCVSLKRVNHRRLSYAFNLSLQKIKVGLRNKSGRCTQKLSVIFTVDVVLHSSNLFKSSYFGYCGLCFSILVWHNPSICPSSSTSLQSSSVSSDVQHPIWPGQ